MEQPPPPTSSSNSSSSSSSVFSRRPSFFGGKSRHKASRSNVPATLHLPPTSPVQEHNPTVPPPDVTPPVTGQYASHAGVPTTPQKRRQPSRHSISSTVGDIGLQLRRSRSTSLRSAASSNHSHKRAPSSISTMHSVSLSPEKTPAAAPISASRPTLSISTFARNKAKSSDNIKADGSGSGGGGGGGGNGSLQNYDKTPLSAPDKPKPAFGMAVPIPLRHPPSQKEIQQAQRQASNAGLAPAAPIPVPNGANPNIIFQHIQELASKRISTLDYLRKAHEGRIYWFNTLLFSKTDLTRLPSFNPRNQSRRATHYLLLGFSLPTILDLHANSPADYLRALNALLIEFEQYQSMHPPDGPTQGSLSRARIPQMFKRANLGGKGRRSSSATGDFPLLTPQSSFGSDTGGGAFNTDPPTDDLLPNETYLYLQTPSLPFDPDFFSTFATLCDVLIDCYTKMLSMLSTPETIMLAGQGVPSTVGDLFSKADARVRKIILAGVVREFEESCRAGIRGEIGGVGKVVLGGLM